MARCCNGLRKLPPVGKGQALCALARRVYRGAPCDRGPAGGHRNLGDAFLGALAKRGWLRRPQGNFWLEHMRGIWRALEPADYPTALGELMMDRPASVSKVGRVATQYRAGCERPLRYCARPMTLVSKKSWRGPAEARAASSTLPNAAVRIGRDTLLPGWRIIWGNQAYPL